MIDDPQSQRPYNIETTEVFRSADIWVRRHALAPGERFPWHYHPTTYDECIALNGCLTMTLRNPPETLQMRAGEHCRVEPGRIHRSSNVGTDHCIFLSIQGPGPSQFIQVEDEAE